MTSYQSPVALNRPTRPLYAQKQAIISGAIQIVIGCICVVAQITGIACYAPTMVVGTGIWCGVMFIISGSIGIGSGKQTNKCMIIAYMVLSIISSAFCAPLVSFAIIDAVVGSDIYSDAIVDCSIAEGSILALMAVLECSIAIWASVNCCRGFGCCQEQPQQAVVLHVVGNDGTAQIALMGQPQGGVVYAAPQASASAYMIPPGMNQPQSQWTSNEVKKTALPQDEYRPQEPDTISNRSDPPAYDHINI